jgi:hypothetical protein
MRPAAGADREPGNHCERAARETRSSRDLQAGPPLQTFTPIHEPSAAAPRGMNRCSCSPEHGLARSVEREAPSSSA